MDEVWTGGCQCGAVRFRGTALVDNAHVCHCRMCQKATGNFFAPLVGIPLDALTFTRGAAAEFRSSASGVRGFCRDCGTPLYFRVDGGAHVSFMIVAFDAPAAHPLSFEYGVEGTLPQVAQLGRTGTRYVTEEDEPEDAARIRASNRQHPDHDT